VGSTRERSSRGKAGGEMMAPVMLRRALARERWLLLMALLWPVPSHAVRLDPVLTGLQAPLYVTHSRDGSGRLFIVEQGGRIKLLKLGAGTPTVFLDISSRVIAGGERGLLGLAFHPQFATNRRFFVNYTRTPDGATVIAEYQGPTVGSDVADPASERIVLVVAQPFDNHNGGMIEFGPDGFLYIAFGDGGSGNDPQNHAQNPNDLLGKILRIDVNGAQPYAIPPDNPFAGGGGRPEIYALGFRNPFRFSFDRLTGSLLAGDVGQSAREEIDVVTRGGNYGWRVFEGSLCTGLGPAPCDPTRFVPPIAEYDHQVGRCAVIGGYVYRGQAGSLPLGSYVFGDLCTGEIFLNSPSRVLVDTTFMLSSFGEDEAGEVYVVDLAGAVYRFAADTPPPPDGDAKADIAVYRGGTVAEWFIRRSSDGGLTHVDWGCGSCGDVPVAVDYDGDGFSDVAVFRTTTAEWFIRRSADGGLTHLNWGCVSCGDRPVATDYDGDGRADVAVYRPTTGQWFILRSSDGGVTQVSWGCAACGDIPVPADYDGDGRADIAVYRPTTGKWFILRSSDGAVVQLNWGCAACGDIPVPADYDRDGRTDVAVYRPSTGQWFILRSLDGAVVQVNWGCGSCGDRPVPADYDGDGRTDVAVYRPSTGQWFILRSTDGGLTTVPWGAPGQDQPVKFLSR
jgi:glucose/arabinose dehydrogenase